MDTPCCDKKFTATSTSSRITTSSGQDSMKMVEVLCDTCIRPITNMQFYKCTDEECNFVIHVWCTRLPTQVMKTGFKHEPITLQLLPQLPNFMGVFQCYYCELHCNGFGYYCQDPRRTTDVYCGVTPEYITHKSHPIHVLRKTIRGQFEDMYCRLCLSDAKKQLFYSCWTCKFHTHTECALLWPETIRHKYDKHLMTLRYCPAENYSGDYFCEVCEEEFNPNGAFYHCDQCVQSMHPACVVEKGSTWAPFYLDRGVDQIENIQGEGIFKVKGHPHPLSLCLRVESDGKCAKCGTKNYKAILKCLECKFVID
ncbi:B-box-type zinc finger [Tanacetum coccineum]